MKNKVINLFSQPKIVQNTGVKYSALLEQFIAPFANDFADVEYYDDIFEFAINAWNFGNMQLILPEGESDAAINAAINAVKGQDINLDLLKRMMDYKVSNFKEYTNFIEDYEIKESGSDPVLSVITQEKDAFLTTMLESMEADNEQNDFEENYINRTAIIVKPLQPFLDWCSNLYPNDTDEMQEARTYLISEEIEDVEVWLKKKFDRIFEFELESWHFNKKEWPQKRNYKMFKEWFQIDISPMVYDFETKPVLKMQ